MLGTRIFWYCEKVLLLGNHKQQPQNVVSLGDRVFHYDLVDLLYTRYLVVHCEKFIPREIRTNATKKISFYRKVNIIRQRSRISIQAPISNLFYSSISVKKKKKVVFSFRNLCCTLHLHLILKLKVSC